MITFNADEIFEMAEQIERDGAAFYRKAAESIESEGRDMLVTLAEMEDQHEKTFAAMRAELSDAETAPVTADPNNEGAMYLQAMAEGKVFLADPEQVFEGEVDIMDILNVAIDMEKDSIVFYQSMKSVVPKKAGQDKIQAIVEQEIGHILILSEQVRLLCE